MNSELFNLFMRFTALGFAGSLSLWVITFCGFLVYKAFWNSIN